MAFTLQTHIDLLSNSIQQNALVSLAAFAMAMLLEFMIIPHVIFISRKKQLFNTPTHSDTPTQLIPRLGGVSFLPVIILSFWPALALQMKLLDNTTMAYGAASFSSIILIICGGIPLLLMGVKDDLVGVHHKQKIITKVAAALLLVSSGNYINNLYGLFGIEELSPVIGIPLTVLLVVYILRAFRFTDKVDGLGGILGGIAATTMGIHLILEDNCPYSIMACSIVGMLLPFLYYNFSRKKKIFMGTAGSLTLSYLLAFMMIHYSMHTAHTSTESLSKPIIIAWSVLFVPLFDTFRVLCVRLLHRKPLFKSDHSYIYNKLLDLGFSHKETTTLLGVASIVVILFNTILRENEVDITWILLINLGLCFLFCFDLFRQKNEEDEEDSIEVVAEVPEHIVLGPYSIATQFSLQEIPTSKTVVNTINPHSWVTAESDQEFKDALLCSDTLVPDGVGVIMGTSWICKQPMRKLAGADLHQMVLDCLVHSGGGSVFYLGASQHTLDLLIERLKHEYPDLRVGSYSPPYRSVFTDEESKAMIAAVNAFAPDVLFVGMTAPKQEKWINAHRNQLEARMISGIGAVFDFYAGTTNRPPQWMIHCGLEWLGRLVKEPRRMWRRNFISTPLFMWAMVKLKMKKNNTQVIHEYENN